MQKQTLSSNGYLTVWVNGKRKYVHRLVAEEHIPNPENKPCVNHIDGDKLNNGPSNLEWVTYSENMQHAFDNGLNKANKVAILAEKGGIGIYYPSMSDAKQDGFIISKISECCSGKYLTHKGYNWSKLC